MPENKKTTYFPSIGIRYCFKRIISLRTEFLYEERGWYGKIFTLDPSNGNTEQSVKADFFYSFLTMPIISEFDIGDKIEFFANIGLNNSLRIGGATKIDNVNVISLDFVHPEDKTPIWDFSWTSGVGFRVRISDKFKLISEGSFYRSLTPIGTREPIEKEIFHKGYRLSIGVEY